MTQILFSGAVPGAADVRGVTALLGVIDASSGELVHRCEYKSPASVRAPNQKMQFTGFHLGANGAIRVCTHTELVRFEEWPPRTPASTISLPGFNDLHHCVPWGGGVAVANTGLETVDLLSSDGDLSHRWDLAPERPNPIDGSVDYRRFADTKPHLVHPNHVFVSGGELWVTELTTSRARSVTGGAEEVPIRRGRPHDGSMIDGLLTFTTTNSGLVQVDPERLEVVGDHDLAAVTPDNSVLGWCRGVAGDPSGENRFFVGFSFPRGSRWREYAFRVKHRERRLASRIGRYDVREGRMIDSVPLLANEPLVVFQLAVLPKSLEL